MLIVEPRWTCEEWVETKFRDSTFDQCFRHYRRSYVRAVMELPVAERLKIRTYLLRGFDHRPINAEAFHCVVVRELDEEGYEPSNKIAKLVTLVAMAKSLPRQGVQLLPTTLHMLNLCVDVIPSLLLVAVDDHFGVLHGLASQSKETERRPPHLPPFETGQ